MCKEDKKPLVSVAIVTYNQLEFLKECIESVLSQTYENIEIVIADDGSTDGTYQVLNEYRLNYPEKFKLHMSEQNQGITKNSNNAHFLCTGKYIFWTGGDDVFLPTKVEKQVNYLESHPECNICYHNLDVFESSSNKTLRLFNSRKNSFEGKMSILIRESTFNGACSNAVRRSSVPKNGFDESLPVASDWLYWIECLRDGGTINYIDEVLGRYRRHPGNITETITSRVGQNEIDHLNTCNIVIGRYPEFFDEAMIVYSKKVFGLRKKVDYLKCVSKALGLSFNYKYMIAIIVYVLSFKKVRL